MSSYPRRSYVRRRPATAPSRPRARRVAQGVVAVAPAPAPAPRKKGGLLGRIARGLGRAVKPVAAHALGIGQQMAIRKLNTISGHGDYTIKSNTLMRSDGVPMFQAGTNGVVVAHREFIQDIYSSQDFVNTVFPIQPALPSTFPWLSAIAQNFEQYRITGMIFEFKTTSADALNSTNTALGTVILSTNYNALAPPFINKQQMENNFFTSSTKPSMSVIHAIECAAHETPNQPAYVRLGDVSNGDLRLYDLGNFQIATVGFQNATPFICGELWMSYRIELYKPQLSAGLALEAKTAQYELSNIDGIMPFGILQTRRFDSIGLRFQTIDTFPPAFPMPIPVAAARPSIPVSEPVQTLVFPIGTNGVYQITYCYIDSDIYDPISLPPPFLTNCVVADVYQNYTTWIAGATQPGALVKQFVIVITDPAVVATVSFGYNLFSIGHNNIVDLFVQQLNGNLPLVAPSVVSSRDYSAPHSITHFKNRVANSLNKNVSDDEKLFQQFKKFMISNNDIGLEEDSEEDERLSPDNAILSQDELLNAIKLYSTHKKETPKGSRKNNLKKEVEKKEGVKSVSD